MVKTWHWLIGAAVALFAMGCGTGETVVTAAIYCHRRLVVAASADASCNERLISLQSIVATDPDCVAVYQGHDSGFNCIDRDGGAPDGR